MTKVDFIKPSAENSNSLFDEQTIQTALQRHSKDNQNDSKTLESGTANNLNGSLNGYLTFCLVICVLGSSFQFGWSTSLYNTPYDTIKAFYEEVYLDRNQQNMTDSQFTLYWSITNGLVPLGGVFGGLASGFFADYFGRKNALYLTNILVFVCAALNISSKFVKSFETIMAGRFVAGVLSGLFSGIAPLYLNELPPQNLKGLAGTMNQLTIVVGILTTNILGLPEIFGNQRLWPILVGFMIVPGLSQIGLLFAVESPKYLYINRNRPDDARKALIKLRSGGKNDDNDDSGNSNNNLIEAELKQLASEKEQQLKQSEVKWSDFLSKPTLFRPLILCSFIQFAQQLSGINAVIFYSTSIFKSVGLKDSWPIYATILLNFIQLVMTFACLFLIDRAGRRILLILGMIGMCIASFVLALARILATDETEWLNYLTLVAAVVYIVFFSIGPGPIPWLFTAELFTSESRGKASSIATFVNWSSNFLVTVSFPFIEEAIGSYSFLIFGVLLVLFSIVLIVFMPETKNKSIDEIQQCFDKNINKNNQNSTPNNQNDDDDEMMK